MGKGNNPERGKLPIQGQVSGAIASKNKSHTSAHPSTNPIRATQPAPDSSESSARTRLRRSDASDVGRTACYLWSVDERSCFLFCLTITFHSRVRKLHCNFARPVCDNCEFRRSACEYGADPQRSGPDERPKRKETPVAQKRTQTKDKLSDRNDEMIGPSFHRPTTPIPLMQNTTPPIPTQASDTFGPTPSGVRRSSPHCFQRR